MSIDRGFGIATSSVLADSYDLDALIADTEAARVAALAAQAAAETAETNSETAETNSAASAAASAASAASVAGAEAATAASAAAALVSENNAQSSENDAETAQVAAELAETHAETAETNAETAETAAVVAQTAALASQTSATASQTSATASATSATASATSATASAASAASSASGASSSATDAQSSEDDAATSETNASNSATASASSATASAGSAASSATQATNAATSATTATTQATNASTSATTATTQAGIATTKAGESATSATNSATSATASATSATASAASASAASATLNGVLAAYNNTSAITGNAVDVFIYDTSNDSDGGAWRKRTQATSWYNETLNTSTRGSRKEFPSVAVIVAESNKVTIYDGDTPDLDMWMVFNTSNATYALGYTASTSIVTSVAMVNGLLSITKKDVTLDYTSGLRTFNLISEEMLNYGNTLYLIEGNIAGRQGSVSYVNTSLPNVVSRNVNDVAITVLPNAPIDSTTGLPIPTIAVATDGGVSVIKDDGNVWDINRTTGSNAWQNVSIENNKVYMSSDLNNSGAFWAVNMPQSDLGGYPIVTGGVAYTATSTPAMLKYADNFTISKDNVVIASLTSGRSGLTYLQENLTDATKGSVAYLTSTYNSGYMTGDIKGAWLSDTDTTNVVGTELVTNTTDRDFSGALVDWSGGIAPVAGVGTVTSTSDFAISGLVAGKVYVVNWEIVAITTGTPRMYMIGITEGTGASNYPLGLNSRTFTPTDDTVTFRTYFYGGGSGDYDIDNFSVRLADSDRSVNNNGLQVNGTITKTPVATGADLVAYSGFSASNYLAQPYISSQSIGTGDACIMSWLKTAGSGGAHQMVVSREGAAYNTAFNVRLQNGVLHGWATNDSFSTYLDLYDTTSIADNQWHQVFFVKRGTAYAIYVDGVLKATSNYLPALTDSGSEKVFIGTRQNGLDQFFVGSIALTRFSHTAPTAAQIKEIYEAEKPLFQENAKCTLNGTSDAVQCLAYDDSTSELVVGTSSSLSVFKGLRRVDEELGNFTEVSQQGGMRIVEKA